MSRHVLKSQRASFMLSTVAPPGHYSVAKFLDLHDYLQRATPWCAAKTIVLTPLPGLLAALILAVLPLEPLRAGPTPAYFAHLFCIVVFGTSGAVVSSLVVTNVPSSVYSFRQVALVSLCSGAIQVAIIYQVNTRWLFPVPFFWGLGTCAWIVSASLAHVVVLGKCWQRPQLQSMVRKYGLGLLVQVVQVVIYPAISVLFDHASPKFQVAITLLVPLVKIAIKQTLAYVTRGLQDQHGVVVVAAVEICSSMYQSMILQTAPSRVAMAIIMGIDLLQGVAAIKFFMDRPTTLPHKELVTKALDVLRKQHQHQHHHQQTKALTIVPVGPTSTRLVASSSVAPSPLPLPWQAPGPVEEIIQDVASRREARASRRQLIHQALLVTHVAETILLVEYFEVVVPLLNCVFLLVATQFRSSFFNPRLSVFLDNPSQLATAVRSIVLYTILQALSFLAVHAVMKVRYGLSAGYHLAFVLERHRMPIQGKMVGWLPVILYFTTAHYGTFTAPYAAFPTDSKTLPPQVRSNVSFSRVATLWCGSALYCLLLRVVVYGTFTTGPSSGNQTGMKSPCLVHSDT